MGGALTGNPFVSYGEVARHMGYEIESEWDGDRIGDLVGAVSHMEHTCGNPLISALRDDTMSDQYQLVCIDIETNGLKLEDDVLSISIRDLNPDGTPTDTEFYSLIRSDQPSNPEAFAVNGITREQLKEAPTKEEMLISLRYWHMKNFNGKKLSPMGHNFMGFDKPRVERLLGEAYDRIFHYHVDDSMIIARALQRNGLLPVESCGLSNLAELFKVELKKGVLHHASADTYVCGMVYSKLLKILKPNILTRAIRVFNSRYLGVL